MRKVSGKRTAAFAVTTYVSITAAFYVFSANCNHGSGLEWAAIEGSERTQDLVTVEGFLGHCCGDRLLSDC